MMNNTLETEPPTSGQSPAELTQELLELARSLNLYGSYPELRDFVHHHELEAALQLVRRLRLIDNRPLRQTAKLDSYLRINEHLLLALELKICELQHLNQPED